MSISAPEPKMKVVYLEIVCHEEDVQGITNELDQCEAAECFGLYCLGTQVRDLTEQEKELVLSECEPLQF